MCTESEYNMPSVMPGIVKTSEVLWLEWPSAYTVRWGHTGCVLPHFWGLWSPWQPGGFHAALFIISAPYDATASRHPADSSLGLPGDRARWMSEQAALLWGSSPWLIWHELHFSPLKWHTEPCWGLRLAKALLLNSSAGAAMEGRAIRSPAKKEDTQRGFS